MPHNIDTTLIHLTILFRQLEWYIFFKPINILSILRPVELVSHAIQTTPPPPPDTPRTLISSRTETEEEETETSSWASVTETGNEQISEGQWLISTKSEGEIAAQHIDAGEKRVAVQIEWNA